MKTFKEFIFSKTILRIAIGVFLSWILILGGTCCFLKLNSRPWSEKSVPSVVGLSHQEANGIILDLDLVPVHLNSVYNSEAVPGSVMDQYPPPASSVKSGREIFLTTYSLTPPKEIVIVKEGDNSSIALRALTNKGFIVNVIYEPHDLLINKVVRVEHNGTSLSATQKLLRGKELTLIVGEKVDYRVRVPFLISLTLTQALDSLKAKNLSIGHVSYSDTVGTRNDTNSALVVHQSERASKLVKAGISIDLELE